MQPSSVKVYELAKELGIDSISLLDRLGTLGIRVKNHMSELAPEEAATARSALLAKKSAGTAAKKAPTRTRKKTDSAATNLIQATATAASTDAEPSAAKAAAPIIRRRSKPGADNVDVETHVSTASTAVAEQPEETVAASAAYSQETQEETHEPVLATNETPEEEPSLEAPLEAEPAQPVARPKPVFNRPVAPRPSLQIATPSAPILRKPVIHEMPRAAASPAPAAPVARAPLKTSAELAAAAAAADPSIDPAAAPVGVRKPIIITRPIAPKKSFLKIVEAAAPPQRPVISRPVPGQTGTNGAGKGTTSTALRSGMLYDKDSVRTVRKDSESAEEEAKRRGGAGKEAEIRPEDVRFADYRKKELVFLPKRKRIPVGKEIRKTQVTTPKAIKRIVEMGDTITLQDLAAQLGVKANDVIRKLMTMGQMVKLHSSIDFDTATLVANEYKYEVRNIAFKEEDLITKTEDTADSLVSRPPVVTIMGHVDHGKTSLLDAIRESNVVQGEAGGITQHIGAYTIVKDGHQITFIDTPGHEAFSMMRARGANATDIVILVVAADDGIMPQTREALSHAQAAKVPILVAVNKIDKPGANPEKVKQGLSDLGLVPEDWGGETMYIPVSALKKTNLDKLLEAILLQAEVLDLKANPAAQADGIVLETRVDRGRGPVVSVLVKRGTLRVGDAVVASLHPGRVKALFDHMGRQIKEVTPGMAAEVLGFEGTPNAGDRFDSPATEAIAREIAENRKEKDRSKTPAARSSKASLDELFSKVSTGEMKELGVVIKADVFGSAEAIRDSLDKIVSKQVKIKVLHSAAGGITESDVLLASASNAIIIGFNVRPETKARQLAEAEHIEIKCYSIIYELIDDVKKAMAGLLDKKKVERFLGRAEVRQTFSVPKLGTIAGCSVIDGKFVRGANVRLLRDSRIIFDGKLSSLKRFKDDVKEVATGFECGIGIENYNDLKPSDILEAYQVDLIAQELAL